MVGEEVLGQEQMPKLMTVKAALISQNQSQTYCVTWNPLDQNLIAFGLFDGRILIHDAERNETI